nr:RNA-directed DNA polymerase, eukaryota [Tanacetum cinerariifolium]
HLSLTGSFFFFSSIAVQTSGSSIFNLLAMATTFTGSGNLYCQWELSPGSGNALCILFPIDSIRGENSKEVQSHSSVEVDGEFNASEVDGVAETIFRDNSASFMKHNVEMVEHHSEDPFELYELLNQKKNEEELRNTIPSLSHPPGFPVGYEAANSRKHVIGEKVINLDKESSLVISAKVMNTSQVVQEEVSCLGNKTKKEWVKELTNKNKINFIAIQETKMERISHMDVKLMWRNSNYDYTCSESLGSSGGILCIWEETMFKKDYVTISDSFVAIYGMWIPNKAKILIVAIYAPQQPMFFDQFISSSGLVDVKMEGYAFMWSHPSANKMSKLDRFLISDGVISLFPSITAICLDRHLSDHHPILLCEINLDYGPTPFRLYHSWFSFAGFNEMVEQTWRSFSHSDRNGMIRFKKKLQELKKELDQGRVPDSSIHSRHELKSIHRVFDEGMWITDLNLVKKAFLDHYGARFKKPTTAGLKLNFPFPNRLLQVQVEDLERGVSREEIRLAVWDYGENRSPGPDRFTFEFFRKYWEFVGLDFCRAVEHFFENGSFSKCCNFSSIALIPKVTDAKFVNDYQPISLIGSVYKVVTKIMANWLALVIANIVSETQFTFVAERQILDGPFILNEVLYWCKRKTKKAMFFKVDFAKAYDSALILVNGSPSNEFQFHCGLKQGDPLSPYLFILIMESLHLSITRAVNEGLFKGVPCSSVEAMAASIGCSIMQNKFRYLGIMVGESMSCHKAWDDVVLKLRSRLSKWKAKTLSIGGRHTLLKSVLGASPLYNMSIFKVPKGVLKGDKSFRDMFPRIFALESNHHISVAEKLDASLENSLHRLVRGGLEQQQFSELSSIVESVSLSSSIDRWVCSMSSDGVFSVKEVRIAIDDLYLHSQSEFTRWVKAVPIKVNIFAWRAWRDCLPTRTNLVRRGVSVESSSCPLCFAGEEDVHSVVFRCSLSRVVLRRVCRWWNLDWQD